MSSDIRTRRTKNKANQLKKLFLILKADRILQAAIVLLVVGTVLVSVSGLYVPPFVSQENGKIILTNDTHLDQSGYAGKLSLYAESPGYPIYINISNPGQQGLTYNVYLINDTNNAIGFGPQTLIKNGTLHASENLVITNTSYHMTYLLKINAPNNTIYQVPVYYSQTAFQYPSSNIYLLASGIITMVAGIVAVGMSLIRIHADKDLYYNKLNLEPYEKQYLFRGSGLQITIPWIVKVVSGLMAAAIGFTLFGKTIIFSWIGIILILGGLAYFLNGVVQKATHR